MKFLKVESIGNHFPLVFLHDVGVQYLGELSKQLCSHHFGVGGDGLLAIGKEADGVVRVRMFNPDGTEDFCGNGLRCAALIARREGWVGDSFLMKHHGREVSARFEGDRIFTTLGLASYRPDDVPHTGVGEWFNLSIWQGMDAGTPVNLFGSALTTGSTHVVLPTFMLPTDEIFFSISPKIETDPRFPQRTSVIWCAEEEPNVLAIRIWERGVGETLGCGTGSSAAAANYLRTRDRAGSVRVKNPGGEVVVHMGTWDSTITLEGTANLLFRGETSPLPTTTGYSALS